jgi:hypothetical protein
MFVILVGQTVYDFPNGYIKENCFVNYKSHLCTNGPIEHKKYYLKHCPSEKIIGEIRLKLTFHSQNAKCDPMNFNTLKIFSVSCLNLDFVALSLLVKKSVKNMLKLG